MRVGTLHASRKQLVGGHRAARVVSTPGCSTVASEQFVTGSTRESVSAAPLGSRLTSRPPVSSREAVAGSPQDGEELMHHPVASDLGKLPREFEVPVVGAGAGPRA